MGARVQALGVAVALSMVGGGEAEAQPLGSFTWQLQPFCNRVTVSVTQNGGVYTLDGYDDQCGAGQRAPLVGMATPNPDGTIGFGLHIVTVPGGKSVHVDARMSLATFGGPWTDSAGNSGTLVLNGSGTGAARAVPTGAPVWGTFIQAPAAATGAGLVLQRPTPPGTTGAPGLAVEWGPPATFPPVLPVGIFATSRDNTAIVGASDTMTGVAGSSTSGVGVGGITFTGDAVYGQSVDSGTGVHARSATGIGLLTETASGSTALEIRTGSIKVSGSIRPAFQHTATSGAGGNIVGNLTRLDHPLLNGDPNALVFVEHVYQSPGANVYVPGGVGVYYDVSVGRWTIFRDDASLPAMPAGARFNVLVVKQ